MRRERPARSRRRGWGEVSAVAQVWLAYATPSLERLGKLRPLGAVAGSSEGRLRHRPRERAEAGLIHSGSRRTSGEMPMQPFSGVVRSQRRSLRPETGPKARGVSACYFFVSTRRGVGPSCRLNQPCAPQWQLSTADGHRITTPGFTVVLTSSWVGLVVSVARGRSRSWRSRDTPGFLQILRLRTKMCA